MVRPVVRLSLLAALLSLQSPLRAADPAAEPLPAPRLLVPPQTPQVVPEVTVHPFAGFYRPSHLAVWDYYGVDRFGRYRPRVIYSPYGSYYLYNGEPFPWTQVRQREIMGYIVDSP
jgi:hypothetical protein